MKTTTLPHRLGVAALLAAAASLPAYAGLITNGSFESGFTSWTIADQLGSNGTFFQQSGTASPVNGMPVPAPAAGTFAAMTDAEAGGSHVLYQDFVVPVAVTTYTLGFSLFLNNGADNYYTPATLDWATPVLNQQARVDIIRTSADPFSVTGGDILQTIYQTNIGDPLTSGYNSLTFDVTALLQANQGATLRLRFSEVDNVSFFQMGVDNVDIVSGTPNQNVPDTLPRFMEWVVLAGVILAGARYNRTNRRATVDA